MPQVTPDPLPVPTDEPGIPTPDVDAVTTAFAEQFARATAGDNPFPDLATGAADANGTDTDAPADDGSEPAEASSAEPAHPVEAESEPTESGASLSVPLADGTTFDMDVDLAQRVLALAAWAENLTPEQRDQFAAIEARQAVAIDRAEYDAFAAWQTIRQQQPATGDPFAELAEAGVDEATIAQLKADRAQLDAMRNQRAQPTPQQQQQSQAALDFKMNAYESGTHAWAETRGITDAATLDRLADMAIRSQVIPRFIENRRQYSPTGVLLQEADYAAVAVDAMNFALASDPELHSEVLTKLATPSTPSSGAAHRVEAKKARAASVASAPSTAVPQPSGPPTKNVQELTEQMAAFIGSRMSGD